MQTDSVISKFEILTGTVLLTEEIVCCVDDEPSVCCDTDMSIFSIFYSCDLSFLCTVVLA